MKLPIAKKIWVAAVLSIVTTGACKPDEKKIRQHIPNEFSEAILINAATFPFLCTSAIFSVDIKKEDINKISKIHPGPIEEHIPENSIIYRIIDNAERGCSLEELELRGAGDFSSYLDSKEVFFLEPVAGKLIIFDESNDKMILLEG